jgi:hypothetical protein
MTADLRAAKNMFSAYLNQDFDVIFGTADDAIRAFRQHSTGDELSGAIRDIKTILSMQLSEDGLKKLILQDLGSCYYYRAGWPSAEHWLKHVLQVLMG